MLSEDHMEIDASTPDERDESGVTVVLTAIVLTALMALSGLAIDGGRAYGERRQMQNAADSAALAGTRELDRIQRGAETDVLAVRTAVEAEAVANGAEPSTTTCELIDQASTTVGPCPTAAGGAIPSSASGVRTRVENAQETFFIRVVGQDSFRAAGLAAAQVQSLRSVDPAYTPFMICGLGSASDGFDPPLLLSADGGLTYDFNPAVKATNPPDLATSQWYEIQAPKVPGCGASSSGFKGWVNESNPPNTGELDTWWDSQPGNRAGPARSILSGFSNACENGDLDECLIVVPVCVSGQSSGTKTELYCVKFGAFYVRQTSANSHEVALIGDAAVVGEGQGGGAPTDPNEARIIKLTQ